MKLKEKITDFYVERFVDLTGPSSANMNLNVLKSKMSRIWEVSEIKKYKKNKNGNIEAFFAISKASRIDSIRGKCHYVIFGYSEEEDIAWIKANFLKHKGMLFKESIIEVLVKDEELARFFCENGFFIESVGTFGYVDSSLKILKNRYPNIDKQFESYNLELEPFIDSKDIPEMIKLWELVFKKNPEYFYCGARKTFLHKHLEFLEGKIQAYCSGDQKSILYLIKKNGRILGYCDTGIHNQNPWSESNAGTQFCLLPELRGKKIGVYCYWLMLQDLKSVGVKTFSGNTSNPAVMNLSLKLKRIPTNYLMIKGKGFFSPDYFTNFTDELLANR